MATSFILKTIAPVGAVFAFEHYFLHDNFPYLYHSSTHFTFLPRCYSFVIVVNVIITSFVLIALGFKVGAARGTFKDKAAKEGDKDAEDRYSYPKMYAEGFTSLAKKFNCVQRGHQQALETYTQFVVLSLVGGVSFPLSVSLAGALWVVARLKWAEGYASGEPSKRYDAAVSRGIWSSLIMVLFASVGTAVKLFA